MRHDPRRIDALRQTLVLDPSPDQALDTITRHLATSLDVPIVLVNILDDERDWFKSRVGMERAESPAGTSLCEAFFHTAGNVVVVEDTTKDDRFARHAIVVNDPKVRFYGAARLSHKGHTVGTLCAYDVKPKKLSREQLDRLREQAEAVMELFSTRGGQVDP